jgi:integrase
LLEKLMASVRPEFRADDLVFDPRDPVFGGPACAVAGCDLPARTKAMCTPHYQRWKLQGRPRPDVFAATAIPGRKGTRPLLACRAGGCSFGRKSHGLCERHEKRWTREGRPGLERWLAGLGPVPLPATPPRQCRICSCELWARGTRAYCASHDARWRAAGRLEHAEFERRCQAVPAAGSEHIDLSGLDTRLRLEIQYVLQCRRDEARVRTDPRLVRAIACALARMPVSSLLDEPEEYWYQLRPGRGNLNRQWPAFLRDARRRVEELGHGRGWDIEYPRDVWRLDNLGLAQRKAATISFSGIPQPRLRELVKRWTRWRLVTGLSSSSAHTGVRAMSCFAGFLAAAAGSADDLPVITRELLERYLAWLHSERRGRVTHAHYVAALSGFITAVRQHQWDPALPATAMIFPSDYPPRARLLPRALAEHVAAQAEDPANLARWRDPVWRLITLILMRCGLRVGDAAKLSWDCVARDADGAPYLRYFNHKMKREALVPVDDEVCALITTQQHNVLQRWPAGSPCLFPRPTANLDGTKPYSSASYRKALYRWLRECDIRDEHGRPVHLTPHQWRHTLGTRLINRDVPQEIVQRILDHDSPLMTAHYARLSDTTIRRHWEAARKVSADGQAVTIDPDGPLADAAWAKHRLSRATQALPNGYCSLPMVKTCPHANACLTCPMFVTTAEFLPHHREQHKQTLLLITAAEARGQTRLAEMNRQVATNLGKVITALENPGPGHGETVTADAS